MFEDETTIRHELISCIIGFIIMFLMIIIFSIIMLMWYTNERDNAYVESRRQFNESVMNNARENN